VTASVWDRCRDAVAAALGQVAFDGLPPGRVYVQTVLDEASLPGGLPAVVVTREGEAEEYEPWDSDWDEVVYPVRVWVVLRADVSGVGEDRWSRWREQAFDAFRSGRLGGVPEAWDVGLMSPPPAPAVDQDLPAYQWLRSLLVVRPRVLRARAPVTP
jgi:hypothetical protein